jgi:hypothetical protein
LLWLVVLDTLLRLLSEGWGVVGTEVDPTVSSEEVDGCLLSGSTVRSSEEVD